MQDVIIQAVTFANRTIRLRESKTIGQGRRHHMLNDIKKTLWATADKLRDTLLPRLISGQLRLPATAAILEDACA